MLTLLSLVGFFLFGQEQEGPEQKKLKPEEPIYDSVSDRVLLRQEFAGGITLHSRGWGFHFRKGRNLSFYRSFQWEVEAVSLKSPKQIKTINPYFNNAKSYVYGKRNHVYVLRAGLGIKQLLNRKPYWGGIELRLVYFGGVSLAFAKPVYLYILNYSVESDDYTIDIERYDPDNHGLDNIYGRAPFTHGIENTSIHPGIYGKLGLNFEFGEYNSSIKAVEVGANLDYYPIPIEIMAFNPKQSLFLTFYLNFSFGKRYD
ncbi:MAG TPA: hypothetical protein VK994_00090 [Bacteroidales bacterium]|nr:hypothetical protein [Bacteroidales bacterium]